MTQELQDSMDLEPVALSEKARDKQEQERQRLMLTKAAASRVLGLGRRAIEKGIASGELPFVTIGGKTLIPAQRARMVLKLA